MQQNMSSRVQNLGQSHIRSVTQRVEAVGGVNLGQGLCPLPPHPEVLRAAQRAMEEGHNTYTRADGTLKLKRSLAGRYKAYNGLDLETDNLLVTCGATGALQCICRAFLEPGDEVILFEPVYNYHLRQIQAWGGVPRFVRLQSPEWSFRPEDLAAAFSPRTKLLLFANPNNPCGKVFSRQELTLIGETCRRHGVIAVADEVYEYILADGQQHISLASLPGMFDHTLTVSSASKTLFVTGWRVGWAVGPQSVMQALWAIADEIYVCAPAPLQIGVAHAYGLGEEFFREIRSRFSRKRDQLVASLAVAGFHPHPPQGAYYILADYRGLGFNDDVEAMLGLVEQMGIGAVPGCEFYPTEENTGLLRFCYGLTDEQLDRACALLAHRGAVEGESPVSTLQLDALLASLAALPASESLPMDRDLEILRSRIDRVDHSILELLAQRMSLIREIGHYKCAHNLELLQADRWQVVLAQRLQASRGLGLAEGMVADLLNTIHDFSLREQQSIARRRLFTGQPQEDLARA